MFYNLTALAVRLRTDTCMNLKIPFIKFYLAVSSLRP